MAMPQDARRFVRSPTSITSRVSDYSGIEELNLVANCNSLFFFSMMSRDRSKLISGLFLCMDICVECLLYCGRLIGGGREVCSRRCYITHSRFHS